jgi:hypothetical protein
LEAPLLAATVRTQAATEQSCNGSGACYESPDCQPPQEVAPEKHYPAPYDRCRVSNYPSFSVQLTEIVGWALAHDRAAAEVAIREAIEVVGRADARQLRTDENSVSLPCLDLLLNGRALMTAA